MIKDLAKEAIILVVITISITYMVLFTGFMANGSLSLWIGLPSFFASFLCAVKGASWIEVAIEKSGRYEKSHKKSSTGWPS